MYIIKASLYDAISRPREANTLGISLPFRNSPEEVKFFPPNYYAWNFYLPNHFLFDPDPGHK